MSKLENIIKWVDALESGRHKQKKRCLGDSDSGYCCIGVGCKTLSVDYDPCAALSPDFAEKVGLMTNSGYLRGNRYFGKAALIDINDETNAGFKRIAKLIKTHPDWVFIPEVAKEVKEYYAQ